MNSIPSPSSVLFSDLQEERRDRKAAFSAGIFSLRFARARARTPKLVKVTVGGSGVGGGGTMPNRWIDAISLGLPCGVKIGILGSPRAAGCHGGRPIFIRYRCRIRRERRTRASGSRVHNLPDRHRYGASGGQSCVDPAILHQFVNQKGRFQYFRGGGLASNLRSDRQNPYKAFRHWYPLSGHNRTPEPMHRYSRRRSGSQCTDQREDHYAYPHKYPYRCRRHSPVRQNWDPGRLSQGRHGHLRRPPDRSFQWWFLATDLESSLNTFL